MRERKAGSLTKEPPLEKLDRTIEAVTPGMPYSELLSFAREHTHPTAPGLLRKRFLLVDDHDVIRYDGLLSLVNTEGVSSRRVRKIMYLVWALRDERVRRFICEVVANTAGRWRTTELAKKSNAEFFRQWFPEPSSTPAKARSNIEFFLVETGIYNPSARAVHLELDDGWLADGMQVAAQHVDDPDIRRAMTAAPSEFLIAMGWHGLVNAGPEEIRQLRVTPSSSGEPLEDEGIGVIPAAPSQGRQWTDRTPAQSRRPPKQVFTNEVARERANLAHLGLERAMAATAQARGYEARHNSNIDMYFATRHGTVLAEMKSCHEKNLHSQVRRGLSQLLEYRFVYRIILGEEVAPVLVLETSPPPDKAWLPEWLGSLGVVLAWKEARGTRFVTTTVVPESLAGVVFPQA